LRRRPRRFGGGSETRTNTNGSNPAHGDAKPKAQPPKSAEVFALPLKVVRLRKRVIPVAARMCRTLEKG
jgi:hypothetical protein